MRLFKLDKPIITPLDPRDAFFGGRTEVFQMYRKFSESEIGKYIDICSLYPAVMMFDKYPIGHPIKILRPTKYDKKWFGFIQCKILPPKKLHIPVLPKKINDKLVFTRCYECAKSITKLCTHNDDGRCLIGTWCTNEVKRAIQKGYIIQEIYEVWHFEETSTDLFSSYIKRFMKLKLENTYVPDTKINEFKEEAKKKLAITLDTVQNNPGMKQIAKLCLNSLWGKFGQRDNLPQTKVVNDLKEFYEILLNDKLDNLSVEFVTEELVEFKYVYKTETVKTTPHSNIFIAAFTTASARMRLYDQLDNLGEDVIYCDTDSVVYSSNTNEDKAINIGSMPGQWENELGDNHITEIIAIAPKSYAYTTSDGKEKCMFKGFTSRYCHKDKLNLNEMKKIAFNETNMIEISDNIFQRKSDGTIVNKDHVKKYSMNFDKRVITEKNKDFILTKSFG